MKKKCKECGGIYETGDQEVTLKINHKDIEALEDVMFIELTEEQYKMAMKRANKIWKQICDGEEKWKKSKSKKS